MLANDSMTERSPAPLLEVRGVSKAYGHVQALLDVSMHVDAGEIVALVGDNGAGKSTLVKMIAGAHGPDQGAILVSGEDLEFHSPLGARERGIETVYQDLALAPDLSVWANLFLGREQYVRGPGRIVGWMDKRRMRESARAELVRLQIPISDVDVAVDALSGGQRQAVAVARAVHSAPRLVLMDEPTAALGVVETRRVEDLIRRMRHRGCAILIVSHSLDQVFRLADRICVLRRGKEVGIRHTADTTGDEIVSMITGLR
jgi:simple sugar transport system ATP-binding protein